MDERFANLYDVSSKGTPSAREYVNAIYFCEGLYLTRADGKVELIDRPAYVETERYKLDKDPSAKERLTKFIVEHNVKFVIPRINIVAYDIETYDLDHPGVPLPKSPTSYISCIVLAIYRPDSPAIEEQRITYNSQTAGKNMYLTQAELVARFVAIVRAVATDETLLMGFNSSCSLRKIEYKDAEGHRIPNVEFSMGYDLPFILAKSGVRYAYEKHYAKGGGTGISHCSLFGLRVHMVDLHKWLIEDTRFDSNKPENNTLAAHLAAAGLKPKQNDGMSYAQMRQIMIGRTAGYDKVLEYCAWDAAALIELALKRGFLLKMRAMLAITGNPLSYYLHRTQAANVLLWQCRMMYPRAQFDYIKREKGDKYKGAYNLAHDSAYLAEKPCGMWDFAGLYPSTHMAFSISPFTLIGEFDELPAERGEITWLDNDPSNADIHDPGMKRYAVFRRDPDDPFNATIKTLKDKRAEYKAALAAAKLAGNEADEALNDQLQLAVKVMVNSVYGMTGSPFACYWYNRTISAAVTLGGRIVIAAAKAAAEKYGRLLFVDTDSACVEVTERVPEEHTKRIEYWSKVTLEMNNNIKAALPECCRADLYSFVHEAVFTRAYFPKIKKHYLKMVQQASGESHFETKGFQFTERTRRVRVLTLEFAEKMLNADKNDWLSLLREFVCAELGEIEKMPAEYARKIKLRGKGPISKSLKLRYPEIPEEADVLTTMVTSSRKGKSDHYVPIDKLGPNHVIDAMGILQYSYVTNLAKFWPEIKKFIRDKDLCWKAAQLDPDMLNLRTEPSYDVHAIDFGDVGDYLYTDDISVHEIIVNSEVRAFFDIDAGNHEFSIGSFIDAVKQATNWQDPVILDASSETKTSYHVIFGIKVQIRYLRALARCLHFMFPEIDEGVYTIGHSLRLPCCPKWNRVTRQMENRPFRIPDGVDILDCLITYVVDLPTFSGESYVYSETPPVDLFYDIARDFGNIPPNIAAEINKMYPNGWTVQQANDPNFTKIVSRVLPFICPICNREHGRDAQWLRRCAGEARYQLGCFRDTEDRTKTIVVPKTKSKDGTRKDRAEEIRAVIAGITVPAEITSRKYVKFNLKKKLTFVNSQLGTGKTYRLIKLLRRKYANVVYLSCRRTLSTAMKQRLDSSKFADYRETTGTIHLSKTPRIIIQVDSLQRLSCFGVKQIDLLVLDEWESLLNQLNGMRRDTSKLSAFCSTIFRANKIVAMDGCLNDGSIELLEYLKGEHDKMSVVKNSFQPFQYKMDVFQAKGSLPDELGHMAAKIGQLLAAGKNIVCPVTSRRLAEALESRFSAEYKVLCFTGNDLHVQDGASMFKRKADAFDDINALITETSPRLMVYTTTLSAGVSVDVLWFDQMIGFYQCHVNPIDYIQATGRVRVLRDSAATLYMEVSAGRRVVSAVEVLEKSALFDLSIAQRMRLSAEVQLESWLTARESMLMANAWQLVLQGMVKLGYTIEVHARPETKSAEKFEAAAIPYARIADLVLTQQHIDDLAAIKADETNKKGELQDSELEYASYKAKIVRSYGITADEVNKFGIDLLKKAMSGDTRPAVRSFLRKHKAQFDAMQSEQKVATLKELFGLTPPTVEWAGVDLAKMIAELGLKIAGTNRILAAAEAMKHQTAVTTSMIEDRRREKAMVAAKDWLAWFKAHDGMVTINKSAGVAADGLTGEFFARAALISTEVMAVVSGGRCRKSNPVGRVEALLLFGGTKVNIAKSRNRTHGDRAWEYTISLE